MIAWKERAQSDTDYIRRNVQKNKCWKNITTI